MQLDAGAIGITVAKLGEAEALPGDDVLVAYPILKGKLQRLGKPCSTACGTGPGLVARGSHGRASARIKRAADILAVRA